MPSDTQFETRIDAARRVPDPVHLPAGAGVVIGVAAGACIWAALLVFFML